MDGYNTAIRIIVKIQYRGEHMEFRFRKNRDTDIAPEEKTDAHSKRFYIYCIICAAFSLVCALAAKSVAAFFIMLWFFAVVYLIHCIFHRHMENRKRKLLRSLAASLVFMIVGMSTMPNVAAGNRDGRNQAAIAAQVQTKTTEAATTTTKAAETQKPAATSKQITTQAQTSKADMKPTTSEAKTAETETVVPEAVAIVVPEAEPETTAEPETEALEEEAPETETAAPETEAAKYTFYTVTSTNVYSSDSSDADVLTSVDAYAEIPAYTPLTGAWVHVNVDGADGYIAEDDLSRVDESTYTVYISSTGQKYHSGPKCGSMKSGQEISLADARAAGYTACAKCRPPEK